ncbi:hypothetical protein cyc_07657 [Cyclospora cayetanensis]|uniref:Uncharacterized protein n=1 Tax=Cyclospora cayetanensis TaxID=88456 RepID=A0A1D3D303_9EIME|nr:hypothetical protein cyc_07657 [Cyclospora cayetanensis]
MVFSRQALATLQLLSRVTEEGTRPFAQPAGSPLARMAFGNAFRSQRLPSDKPEGGSSEPHSAVHPSTKQPPKTIGPSPRWSLKAQITRCFRPLYGAYYKLRCRLAARSHREPCGCAEANAQQPLAGDRSQCMSRQVEKPVKNIEGSQPKAPQETSLGASEEPPKTFFPFGMGMRAALRAPT